jgi:RNA polymerase sigma factor (sigma-70 family)
MNLGSAEDRRDGAHAVAARQLIQRHGWGLLPPDALARRAEEHLRAGLGRGPVEAVIGAYCVALYAACSGTQGPERRERAFVELGDYLYSVSCLRFRDLTEEQRQDATQGALERLVHAVDQCRQPIAFLAFAAQHLLDRANAIRRQSQRPVVSLDRDHAASARHAVAASSAADPELAAIAAERQAAISRLLDEFLSEHPRAVQQVDVLRLELLSGLDDAAIGAQLGLRPGSVQSARSRLRRALRTEAKWLSRARDLGLVPDEV